MSRISRRPGTNAPLILGPLGATRVILEDLEIDGNNLLQTAGQPHVVSLTDSPTAEDTQWVISRCYLHGRSDPHAPDWGRGGSNLYIGAGRMACRVLHTTSNYAHHHGIEVNGADALVDGCIVGDNGAHGIVIGTWATTITNSAIYNNTNGIHVTDTGRWSPKRIIITANGIDRNRQSGVLLDGTPTSGSAGVSITNNAFTSNSTDADGGSGHISVHTSSGQVAVGGNIFSILEEGYLKRTSAALHLAEGATALDLGNLYEGGSVAGIHERPVRAPAAPCRVLIRAIWPQAAGPFFRTSSTCDMASLSSVSQSSSCCPTNRTHHASASARERATPASTSVSRTIRSR